MKKIIKMYLLKHFFRKKYGAVVNSSYVSRRCQLAENVIVGKNTFIGDNAKVGKCTYFNTTNGLLPIIVEAGTQIGSYCSIAMGSLIGLGNHDTSFITTHPILYEKTWQNKLNINNIPKELPGTCPKDSPKVHIGNDVWICANAIISAGVKIADGAVIAAGAVVTKDVEAYSIVAGIPAKIIGYRFSDEVRIDLLKKEDKWWNWNESELNKNFLQLYNCRD